MSLCNFCYTKPGYTLALQWLNLLHFPQMHCFYETNDMKLINGGLFLNAKDLYFLSLLLFPSTVIYPLTIIYALL